MACEQDGADGEGAERRAPPSSILTRLEHTVAGVATTTAQPLGAGVGNKRPASGGQIQKSEAKRVDTAPPLLPPPLLVPGLFGMVSIERQSDGSVYYFQQDLMSGTFSVPAGATDEEIIARVRANIQEAYEMNGIDKI